MQHPGQIEFADRQGHHHEGAGEDAGPAVGQHDGRRSAGGKMAPRLAAPSSRVRKSSGQDRQHGADHERQGVQHVAHQNEEPAQAEIAEGPVGDDERQRDGKARDGDRQDQGLLDHAGDRARPLGQDVGRRHADHKVADEAGDGDLQREPDRAA